MFGLGDQLALASKMAHEASMRSLMLGENEVNFSTPPISCAVASSALRSTSSAIGSNALLGSSWPALHDQRAVGMDAGAIAGIKDRGCGYFFDHRRALDHVVSEQLLALEICSGRPSAPSPIAIPSRKSPRGAATPRLGASRSRASVGNSGASTLPMAVAANPTISIGASVSA